MVEKKNKLFSLIRAKKEDRQKPLKNVDPSFDGAVLFSYSFSFLVRFLVPLRDRFISLELLAVACIYIYIYNKPRERAKANGIKITSIIERAVETIEKNRK